MFITRPYRLQKSKLNALKLMLKTCLISLLISLLSGQTQAQPAEGITWRRAMSQPSEWYGSAEAIRISDNVLLYQNNNGGWSKNIDMAQELSHSEVQKLKKEKSQKTGTTIDNGATHTQLNYLARVYKATGHDRFREAFLKGVDFLLEAQYENGGWPQFYPIRKGYYENITFNDNAMIGVMRLLRGIARNDDPFSFVDEGRKQKAEKAVEKGLDIILKTQVVVDGKLTAWCAQHDKEILLPAKARAYELPSLSGGESVGIVKYLMEVENQDERVILAVKSAIAWFEEVKIEGQRVERKKDPALPKGFDLVVVDDPEAGPLWARFYEIGTNRPMFVGRDGVVKYRLEEIEYERRVGYSYLRNYAEDLLKEDYPQWLQKL
ncbi:pectate lyase [Gaoshiqia sediminis]|uniref:Pectate lyase n=1 Tax=Gaoshiqia sediminis TaxID=2986998 RepID=A0AA41Y6Z8_9BACT|nr:pectate lyase [Gaoshiqia sediminis]MCW0483099.1 pectate lyase [Gaoshiqia sediminis]